MAKDNSIAFGPSYPMDDQGASRAAQAPATAPGLGRTQPERTPKPMNETKIANREADLVNAWARGETLPPDPTMTTAEQTAAFTRATNAQADFAEANMSGHEQAVKYAAKMNKSSDSYNGVPLADYGDPDKKLYPITSQSGLNSLTYLDFSDTTRRRIEAIATRKGLTLPTGWAGKRPQSGDTDMMAQATDQAKKYAAQANKRGK